MPDGPQWAIYKALVEADWSSGIAWSTVTRKTLDALADAGYAVVKMPSPNLAEHPVGSAGDAPTPDAPQEG